MNIILIVFLFLIFTGAKFSQDCFFENYCAPAQTNAIKGIFAIVIMLCHSIDYFPMNENDLWLTNFAIYMKQLIVVPILFYSGYGIMESIQRKGYDYVKSLPVKHILRTMVWADIAMILFALYYLVSGINLSVEKFLASLIFWDYIENNTWYFFVIIILYIITYVSFSLFRRNKYLAVIATCIISLVPFWFLIKSRDIFWYNTFFVYHFGMWFSLLKPHLEKMMMKNNFTYLLSLLFFGTGYAFLHTFGSFYFFIICCCFFCAFIVCITMKLSINNSFLQFAGKHVFGIYAFQRLPMRMIRNTQHQTWEKFIISFIATCLLCCVFDYVIMYLDKYLFNRRK